MMAEKKPPAGDYEVGYGKPPKHSRYEKGQSGNPKGRPKRKKSGTTDVCSILNEPLRVKVGGKECEMQPFEATVQQLARNGLAGHLPSLIKFIRLCEEYGLMTPPKVEQGGGVIEAPRGYTPEDWLNIVAEWVPVDEP